ncbi:sulfite exporter TauE/SafE family protein [Pseudoruegeria sp. SHC-113]|uniref:sulfite exporter TauE/SafE family protein n=1 Tax=Pseudoruegeria sp. SHC-113 TaxID=2855439 RepID=UPI0021BAFE22|nr:sulfite exporter TauE/SafE family protein [Pseudoruegeria sp. SHC-113]MCT8159278.1 sulfite exporter TauE/SafE family protein [Pseudoruegeria sp. SHC-113]
MLVLQEFATQTLLIACAVALLAGFVKGATGFAMPMIMISGLGSIMAPDLALAALILPTVVMNAAQALRQGVGAALASARRHWLYLALVLAFIALSAQLVRVLSSQALFLMIGVPVTLFAVSQLLGWRLSFPESRRRVVEVTVGAIAGFCGGISGVWGPPTVAYLTALDTPKQEAVRVQGVIYGAGAVVLLLAHMRSGIFNAETAPLSALLLLPAGVGMALGFRAQDRMDQTRFRTATLVVLVVAGLNLVRRGVVG